MASQSTPSWLESLRQQARSIFQAGVDAADPQKAVERSLRMRDRRLEILLEPGAAESGKVRSEPWRRIHVLAFGKAACTMAQAAQRIIPDALWAGEGIAVTNYENVTEVPRFQVIGAGHPLPDANGFKGAQAIADRARQAREGELVLVLISGGGSALAPYPAGSLSLDDKIATTQLLLACGADIGQINTVRKHLSLLKGGGLARLAAPASLHALILSDVLGDDLSSIASGPTVPDPTTYADAIRVFETKGVWEKVPASVRAHLQSGREAKLPETPKPGDSIFTSVENTLVGSNRLSLDAVKAAAEQAERTVHIFSTALCGEAREEAENLVRAAQEEINKNQDRPFALVAGGETTVTLRGNGRGGRNQELAFAFAVAAEKYQLPERWVFLSGGTDGRDGPTDAAGGIVDPWTLKRIEQSGKDAIKLLDNNDSYQALSQSNDLLQTGATGTNVADLQILLVN